MSIANPRARALVVTSVSFRKHDGPAGTVTLLVALPLCLGIALGSGAPVITLQRHEERYDQARFRPSQQVAAAPSRLKDAYRINRDHIDSILDPQARWDRLVEMNVSEQLQTRRKPPAYSEPGGSSSARCCMAGFTICAQDI